MCGIAGIFSSVVGDQDLRAIRRATTAMTGRGPDGEGIWHSRSVVLGHRRLAILDPAHGQQPWIDPETGVVAVYNGELYNYPQLRRELERHGQALRTQCDTEAVVKSYSVWGHECMKHWAGMFALALYDPRNESLWLVRDRLGIKPLFYTVGSGRFAFASSVAALMEMPGLERRIDPAALAHYLATVRVNLGEQTLLRGVRLLEPGGSLFLARPGETPLPHKWWTPPVLPEEEKPAVEFDEAAVEIGHRVRQVAHEHQLSDAPVGGFLSGGLDSSILAATALAANGRPGRPVYSTGYRREDYGEWPYQRQAARHFDLELTEVPLEEADFLYDCETLIAANGLPLSTPNEVPIYRLSQAFGQRYKVALTGEGADEVFGGYAGPTFCAFDFDRSAGSQGGIDPRALLRHYGRSHFSCRRAHFRQCNSWIDAAARRQLLGGDQAALEAEAGVEAYYDGLFAETSACSTLEAYLHAHLRVNLEGLLLRLDSSTMAASVEGRVPFCDHRLVERLFEMPAHYKLALRPGLDPAAVRRLNSFELTGADSVETKRLLRHAFAAELPEEIVRRPKRSFPVPFIEWFQGPLRPVWEACLSDSDFLGNMLPVTTRQKLFEAEHTNAILAWPLINLALWADHWKISV
ncbi:asparagine synthase (glutamine-hydrolyzing) [Ruficoccus amylovorans]|uniref:asparagine synthase (glutamine-hydrolyzing) n=1 Tax=Ruficoccus amylovorans TaxID=1804625 RepID=A0A842HEY0_9BACT|nr:asparagine synthase (glutamine-hydrolyzing) [Ruficoccus amylovorans]MBC2594982.1 asparagine synthase (glutamine-hydrolyzing) [Ruficoccus amylovorans]